MRITIQRMRLRITIGSGMNAIFGIHLFLSR
jgi:hypothetical protein